MGPCWKIAFHKCANELWMIHWVLVSTTEHSKYQRHRLYDITFLSTLSRATEEEFALSHWCWGISAGFWGEITHLQSSDWIIYSSTVPHCACARQITRQNSLPPPNRCRRYRNHKFKCSCLAGWPWGMHICLSDPAINCHPGVSQAGWFISVCAIPRMDVKWVFCLPGLIGDPSRSVGEHSPAPWNYKFLPEPAGGIATAVLSCPQLMM